jgi:hypothetical protein
LAWLFSLCIIQMENLLFWKIKELKISEKCGKFTLFSAVAVRLNHFFVDFLQILCGYLVQQWCLLIPHALDGQGIHSLRWYSLYIDVKNLHIWSQRYEAPFWNWIFVMCHWYSREGQWWWKAENWLFSRSKLSFATPTILKELNDFALPRHVYFTLLTEIVN